uniref:Uncharacterized protein n=1 Tax=Arundo donax TaxID=35708 RepID=A0A0A9E2P1_ARUDO
MPRRHAARVGARGARGAAALAAPLHVGARLRPQLPPRVSAIAEHHCGVHGGGPRGGAYHSQQYIRRCAHAFAKVDSSNNSHGYGAWNLGDCLM